MCFDQIGEPMLETRLSKLPCREIDRQAKGATFIERSADQPTGFTQYPGAEVEDQFRFFGDRHELAWRDQPPFGMLLT